MCSASFLFHWGQTEVLQPIRELCLMSKLQLQWSEREGGIMESRAAIYNTEETFLWTAQEPNQTSPTPFPKWRGSEGTQLPFALMILLLL